MDLLFRTGYELDVRKTFQNSKCCVKLWLPMGLRLPLREQLREDTLKVNLVLGHRLLSKINLKQVLRELGEAVVL